MLFVLSRDFVKSYMLCLCFRLNKNRPIGQRGGYYSTKTVSRKFKSISNSELKSLKTNVMKKRSYNKMLWGVRAYQDWRIAKISNPATYDILIDEANLENLKELRKDVFIYAISRFIPEVVKVKDGTDYPGKTLYEMVVSIQRYLNENNVSWKILEHVEFKEVRTVLDNVMKDRASRNIGLVRKQAEYIPLDYEDKMWKEGVLGEEFPDQLRDTVLFLLGINLALRAGDEHYNLRHDSIEKPSQLSFERDASGIRCLVYREDCVTKTNDGGLGTLKKERKVVWIYPSKDSVRCPVRLVDKYVSLCPEVTPKTKKHNFYLRSLEKVNPAQWYGEQVLGRNSIVKVVGKLLKSANLNGYFTNHSLRRTGTTRLFHAGIDRKLVKEFTGHTSDAVDKYQITSEMQRREISEVVHGDKRQQEANKVDIEEESSNEIVEFKRKEPVHEMEISVSQKSKGDVGSFSCQCNTRRVDIEKSDQMSSLIKQIVQSRQAGKAKIKIEIEFCD